MDTTKQNILMCEKAVEIQELWQPKPLDIFSYSGVTHVTYEDFYKCIKDKGIYFKRQKTWLPRQGQLQGMIDWCGTKYSFYFTNHWIVSIDDKECFSTITMEQAWLCIVMKEKYSKVWNGKYWIRTK